jgi:hypothetical protein
MILLVIAILMGAIVIYLGEIYLNLIRQGAKQIEILFNVIKFEAECGIISSFINLRKYIKVIKLMIGSDLMFFVRLPI